MLSRIAYYTYFISLAFACVSGIFRFRQIDTASKILVVLFFSALFNETAGDYMARKYHNNLTLYTYYNILEYIILCIYYNQVIDIFFKWRIGIFAAGVGLILGLLNLSFLQPPDTINSYFLLFEGLSIIGMSLFAFFRLLMKYDSLNLHKYHHFWFMSVLVFFWSVTFLTWGLYDYLNTALRKSAWKINTELAIAGIIMYTCFGLIFLLYPKMQSNHE